MARLRRDTQESASPAIQRPLRVVASGTLFLTHTLSLPTHPEPSSVVRARSVTRSRGGSASTCLAILAQFPSVEAMLVAPLGGNDDGRMIIRDLEKERVSTRFCKIWNDAGVPSAWVLYAGLETGNVRKVNHCHVNRGKLSSPLNVLNSTGK
ncbi:hypothetical protein AcV7_005550 [Taiwanofungus camphoratus]|nr:hypothetical protein AcV7_005550 [Antrodia cinnamomea]